MVEVVLVEILPCRGRRRPRPLQGLLARVAVAKALADQLPVGDEDQAFENSKLFILNAAFVEDGVCFVSFHNNFLHSFITKGWCEEVAIYFTHTLLCACVCVCRGTCQYHIIPGRAKQASPISNILYY